MAGLKEIRNRISSVISTRQITSAMKMVSAARFRKAQDAIIRIRPYADKLHEILTDLSGSMDTTEDNIYATQRKVKRVLIIAITSNRGLCGAFNANVVKAALQHVENAYPQQFAAGDVEFCTIGKKAHELLKSRGIKITNQYDSVLDDLVFDNVAPIAQEVMHKFTDSDYDRVDIIYNQFKNAAVQILTTEQFLPVKIEQGDNSFKDDYIFEPSKEEIVEDIIPKSLKIQFYKALLDSTAAEHGARMTAMHKATDNATELIRNLKLNYNKARQATITNEILEIVGGAEALNG